MKAWADQRRLARALCLTTLAAWYFIYVFGLQRGTWLTTGLGDWLDPYLINNLLEQWRFSVMHVSDPASPPMFYPATGTLGYSVGLILYAPYYVALRVWLHPFPAYTLTLFLVLMTGTLCLYVIARRHFMLGFVESLLITALFSTSANVIDAYSFVWAQTLSVFLIPPILLIGLVSMRLHPGPLRNIRLWFTGFGATLLLTQDIYTGLLAALIAGLLLLGARLCLGWPAVSIVFNRRPARSASWKRRAGAWISLAIALLGAGWAWIDIHGSLLWIPVESHHHHAERPASVAAVMFVTFLAFHGIRTRARLIVPKLWPGALPFGFGAVTGITLFLYIYLQPFLEHYGFPQDQLMNALLPREPGDLWRLFTEASKVLPYESGRSFGIVFALLLTAWMPWLRLSWQVRFAALWFGLISIFVLLVAVQVHGHALWPVVTALPGFSAIRDPKRIIYVYELTAAIMVGLFLKQLPTRTVPRRIIAIGVLGLLVGTWTSVHLPYRRPINVFARWVTAPIEIDPSCRSFFIKGASAEYMSRNDHMWGLYGNDAMFIATRYKLPTLNGYSAWTPAHWDLANPQSPDYTGAVDRWIRAHHLEGVCEFDIDARTMKPHVLQR